MNELAETDVSHISQLMEDNLAVLKWITICYSLLILDSILSIMVQIKGKVSQKDLCHSTSKLWCSLTMFENGIYDQYDGPPMGILKQTYDCVFYVLLFSLYP